MRAMAPNPLLINARIAATILSLPLLAILASVLLPTEDIWAHLFDTTLGLYIADSAMLAIGVVFGAAVVGGGYSVLCSLYDFPGRQFFGWALILPLAFPVYIAAYAYTDMFNFGGWGYRWAHDLFGYVPRVRSPAGAIAIFTLALYPYVYLLVRSALKQQSAHILQAAQVLGLSGRQILTALALPTVRPAIVAACMLAMMETLSDYAAVRHFGIQTMSVGIFRTWFGLGSLGGAAQLALLLLCFTVGLTIIERHARRRMRYYGSAKQTTPITRQRLGGGKGLAAAVMCALPIAFGFVLPLAQLIRWLLLPTEGISYWEQLNLIAHTLALGAGAALLTTALAILLAYGDRLRQRPHWLTRIATAGYAIPGVIVAIGVLLVGSALEKSLGFSPRIFTGGTLVILYFAYAVRFMTLGFNAVENSLLKISPNIDRASATLNVRGLESITKVHMPIIRPSVLIAALLVFVEVVKEVPATLVLRPFDFNTLAIYTYELASTERLSEMGLPALGIVLTSMLPLFILWKRFGLMRYLGHRN